MSLLRVGLIKKVHGLKGEVKVFPLTDNPLRFKKLKSVYLMTSDDDENLDADSLIKYGLEHSVVTPKEVILKLAGVDNIEDARLLIGRYVSIDKSKGVPLSEWEFYTQDLIGCRIMYDGNEMGVVTDILNCGANDNMLVETSDGREIYYPFVRDFILNVDVDKKLIEINQSEDFFDI